MGDLLALAERLGPAAGWLLLLVGLALYVVERATGWEGVITRTIRAIARRQITREQRAAELEEARRVRGSAEVRDLRRQVSYLELELGDTRQEAGVRDSEAHRREEALREELRDLRDELSAARDEIAELKRRMTAQEGSNP